MKYTIKWESNRKIAPIIWEKYEPQFPRFCCIFLYYGKLIGKPIHFSYEEVYHRMEIAWGNITHTMGKVWVPLFPGSTHLKRFVAFSRTMRNWCGNPCISQMMKYIIGWQSNGKKAPILCEKHENQFHWHSQYHGFCCIFPYCGKFIGKPMHFPYAEVYHRMGTGWEKSTHTMGKIWLSIS